MSNNIGFSSIADPNEKIQVAPATILQVESTIVDSEGEDLESSVIIDKKELNRMEESTVNTIINNNPRNTLEGRIAGVIEKKANPGSNSTKPDPQSNGYQPSSNFQQDSEMNFDFDKRFVKIDNGQKKNHVKGDFGNPGFGNHHRYKSQKNLDCPGMPNQNVNDFVRRNTTNTLANNGPFNPRNPPKPSARLQQLLSNGGMMNMGMNNSPNPIPPPMYNYNGGPSSPNNYMNNNGNYGGMNNQMQMNNFNNPMPPPLNGYNNNRNRKGSGNFNQGMPPHMANYNSNGGRRGSGNYGPGGMGQNFQGNNNGNFNASKFNGHQYRNMNWSDYSLQRYGIAIDSNEIHRLGVEIFLKHDTNSTGTLEIAEFPSMLNEFFQRINKPSPTVNDCFFLMYKYDINKDGKIDMKEFLAMIDEIVNK